MAQDKSEKQEHTKNKNRIKKGIKYRLEGKEKNRKVEPTCFTCDSWETHADPRIKMVEAPLDGT